MDLTLSRKLSILAYLAAQGPIPLRELALHYHLTPEAMHRELRDLFLVELTQAGGYECPIDLDFSESYSINDYVSLQLESARTLSKLHLGFDEVITVLAWIDYLLPIADDQQHTALLSLRDLICAGLAKSGYQQATWPVPSNTLNRTEIEKLNLAMARQHDVQFAYWKAATENSGASSHLVTGTPLEFIATRQPAIHLHTAEGIRTYRLDRITDVAVIKARRNRKDLNTARSLARKEQISFTGGKLILKCTPQAQWIIDAYPEIEIISDTDTRTSAHDSSATTPHFIRLKISYANTASLFAILMRLGKQILEIEAGSVTDKIGLYARKILDIYPDGFSASSN
ncbi:helix-turn-helix transcriptional regulator [Arcanobacterium hippocoleae]|uniref:DNA-binding transcriptional regulator YafY n=1 Tax=Arcanobacterium hippocoleae TaxID=149017 RepID=A0ABU1T0D6_9ACTO|nr:WYL domain-containing protein [Arcanobacterium hippocoleae]MDR6938771.1 putative DNA-binding transcriptional regulator YafY [Arcanobacterium hippocoleae]